MKTKGESKPIIAVTMGDPAGIGPEIAVKALSKPDLYDICNPLVIGDLKVLERVSEKLEIRLNFKVASSPKEAVYMPGTIDVIDLNNIDIDILKIGKASAGSGSASIRYIEKAVEYALRMEVDAVATGPISKKAIQLAGSRHIGHTEIFADLCGITDPLTMFWVRGARIFFLTRHMPLIDAVRAVKKEHIVETAIRISKELHRMGLERPLIAIAALNPHASDDGLLGEEEKREIIPAVEELKRRGIRAVGPVPADTVFFKALEGHYDAVLSLYHDQGHIAAKTFDFYGSVSVTLGLPFIRTSVDHGTAYDIAWKGVADSRSLEEAIKLAARLVRDHASKE